MRIVSWETKPQSDNLGHNCSENVQVPPTIYILNCTGLRLREYYGTMVLEADEKFTQSHAKVYLPLNITHDSEGQQ